MNAKIRSLFEELNTYWFMSGTGYEGENPGCYELKIISDTVTYMKTVKL